MIPFTLRQQAWAACARADHRPGVAAPEGPLAWQCQGAAGGGAAERPGQHRVLQWLHRPRASLCGQGNWRHHQRRS